MICATTCACHRMGRPSSSSLSLQWSAEKGSSRSMGHQHLGTLPQSKKWQRVVGLISGGADVRDVASAVSAAAERAMIDAANDPAVRSAFYLLTQVLLAARKEHFVPELRMLGLRVAANPLWWKSSQRSPRPWIARSARTVVARISARWCNWRLLKASMPWPDVNFRASSVRPRMT